MKIVIVGDGKVGFALASQLSAEGHDITVIDNDAETLRRSIESLDVIGIRGNGASYPVQIEAGVPNTDLLIAATSGDELNILCCMLAKKLGAKHTIARIRNPEYSDYLSFMKDELGLSMVINPERAAAREIMRIINFPSAISIWSLAKGRVEIVECRIMPGSLLIGQKIFDIKEKYRLDILICVLEQNGHVSIPKRDDIFMQDDKIHVTGSIADIVSFMKLAGHTEHKIRSVMIVGGGRISYYLAENILNMGLKVKVIEKSGERCAAFSELLPYALVINGDGTDQQLLEEEGITDVDAFVALTNMDEENLIVSMYASKKGTKKIVAKINRLEYMDVIKSMGIDSVISPKSITAYQIVRYVRAMQNTMGSKVDTLYKIANEQAEVLEFTVAENTKHQMVPLRNVTLKKNLIIAAVVRAGKRTVPCGDTTFQKGDTVIVVTMSQQFNDMNDIFSDDE